MSSDSRRNASPLPPHAASAMTAAADVSFASLDVEHRAQTRPQAEPSSLAEKRRSGTSEASDRSREKKLRHTETILRDEGHRISQNGSIGRRSNGKTGGFMLDSMFANGQPQSAHSLTRRRGKRNEWNGPIPEGSRTSRISADYSSRGSPLSREEPHEEENREDGVLNSRAGQVAMDPAQLVQMALSLSESRKRHVSTALPGTLSPARGRLGPTSLQSAHRNVRSASSDSNRASYVSGDYGRSSLGSYRNSQQDARQNDGGYDNDNIAYTFSPATLSRGEKARRYFELASEHRRLLEHLPPLKPNISTNGNSTSATTGNPSNAKLDRERRPQDGSKDTKSGQSYNPLQALRNRRLRNREGRPLAAPPDTWQETGQVKQWIDDVEAATKASTYGLSDGQTHLPTFSGEGESGPVSSDSAKRHKRSDTATSVIVRPENGWTIEPAELLADTYWLERGDNKTIVEDRNGKRIFPALARMSVDVPRGSKESQRATEIFGEKHGRHEESEDDDRVRHRRRNMLPIPGRLRRSHMNRSSSVSSGSSVEGRKPRPLQFGGLEGGDENIGPLERHMRSMIAKDESGELSSPELVSPDHWDSKTSRFSQLRHSSNQMHHGSAASANGHLSVETAGHRRSRSTDGRMPSVDQSAAYMGERTADSPTSPLAVGNTSSKDGEAPSFESKSAQLDLESKRDHPPSFRTHSREQSDIEKIDFVSRLGKPLSPVMSADSSTEMPRLSLDIIPPAQISRLKTADSSANSLHRNNTTATSEPSAKDSSSSVGRRFFKGGRLGELVRNEGSRLGDRFRYNRDRSGDISTVLDVAKTQSEASDVDDDSPRRTRGGLDDIGDADSQVSPRGSFEREDHRPRYYNSNLPSFISPAGRNRRSNAATPMSEISDPFAKQQYASRRDDKPSNRFSHLIPPKINLPDDDSVSNPDLSRSRSGQSAGLNGNYDRRRSASQNDLARVPTGSTITRSHRIGEMPMSGLAALEAKRHWSISDEAAPAKASKITMRDIARVRALLLASGIKAHEIYQKAYSPREQQFQVYQNVAKITGQNMGRIPRREENVVAARLLSDCLSSTLSDFEKTLQHFQGTTAKNLGTQLEELSHRASEQLTNIVHEASDEADAFNVELTTKQPQEVKRVDEAVDAMFRQRRRQFRLFRRAGFKLLEWLVLGVMWWVWFVVVLFNSVKKTLFWILSVFRWLLWF